MFSTVRAVLVLIALLVAGCGMEEEVTKPVFLEARMKETQSGIEAVFLAATASHAECEARTALAIFTKCPTCKFTRATCSDALPTRFQGVWDGKPYRATYLHLTHGVKGERDGRVIFFSVPSSVVSGACPVIESKIRETYKGTIECRNGTVG